MRLMNLFALLLLFPSVFATISVTPTTWTVDSSNASTLNQVFTIANPDNQTVSGSISQIGNGAKFINVSNSTISLPPFSSSGFFATADLSINASAGSYTSNLILQTDDGSPTVSISLTKQKWVYSREQWFKLTDVISIEPHALQIHFDAISNIVELELFQNGKNIGNDRLDVGQSTDDKYGVVRVTISQIDGVAKEAKIKIETDDPETELTLNQGVAGSNGQLLSSIGTGKKIGMNRGDKKDIQFTVRNAFSVPVDIKNIDFDTFYADLFVVSNADYTTLKPNADLPITVTIDASKAQSGDYAGDLKVLAYLPDSSQYTLTIPFTVKVLSGTGDSPSDSQNLIPNLVFSKLTPDVGEPISLTYTNILETDKVLIQSNPVFGLQSAGATKFLPNTRVDSISFSTSGIYNLIISVYRGDQSAPVKVFTQTILAGLDVTSLNVSLKDNSFAVDKKSTVLVMDADGDLVGGAKITVNGKELSGNTFTPTSTVNDYVVCASLDPFKPTDPCPTFSLGSKFLTIVTNPLFPVEGDKLRVSVLDASSGADLTLDSTVQVDGSQFVQGEQLITGDSNITVSVKGYPVKSIVIPITKKASDVKINGDQAKKLVTLSFDKITSFALFFKDPNTNAEQNIGGASSVDSYQFTPSSVGTYVIQSGDFRKEFTISENSFLGGNIFGIPTWFAVVIFIIVLVVIALVLIARWRKSKGSGIVGQLKSANGVTQNKL